MAKTPPPKTSDPARIRFVLFEADLPSGGDLAQIAHAIQSALKPAAVLPPSSQRATKAISGPTGEGRTETLPPEAIEDIEAVEDVQETIEETPRTARPARKAKGKTPKVLNDIDFASNPSLASFAEGKKTETHVSRYLLVAAWLKEHRDIPSVTADHIYTCYRHMKWPTSVPDFAQPLRQMKHKQLFDSHQDGGYTINHLGLQKVSELAVV